MHENSKREAPELKLLLHKYIAEEEYEKGNSITDSIGFLSFCFSLAFSG
jgi:hypothetical protein